MTLTEHVQWARRRAHAIVDVGDGADAFASMISDLKKHDETHAAAMMCFAAAMLVDPDDKEAVKRWIDGCIPVVPVETR